MSISAASSSVLLSWAHRIGLSNQPGSAASSAAAPNAELAAATAAPCRTSRLVTMIPSRTSNVADSPGSISRTLQRSECVTKCELQDARVASRLDAPEVAVIQQYDRLPEIDGIEQIEKLAAELHLPEA